MNATEKNRIRAEHKRARVKVQRALESGQLQKPARCQDCGIEPEYSGAIHAHHGDYSRPLNVDWLCALCHEKEHKRLRFFAKHGLGPGAKIPESAYIPPKGSQGPRPPRPVRLDYGAVFSTKTPRVVAEPKCLACGEALDRGTTTPVGAHSLETSWNCPSCGLLIAQTTSEPG